VIRSRKEHVKTRKLRFEGTRVTISPQKGIAVLKASAVEGKIYSATSANLLHMRGFEVETYRNGQCHRIRFGCVFRVLRGACHCCQPMGRILGVVVGSGRLTTSVSWSFGFCSISHQHLDMSHNRLVKPRYGRMCGQELRRSKLLCFRHSLPSTCMVVSVDRDRLFLSLVPSGCSFRVGGGELVSSAPPPLFSSVELRSRPD